MILANSGKFDTLGQYDSGPPPGVARPPIYGGGGYPVGYPGTATSNQIPYSSPADIGAPVHYPYSTAVSPYGGSPGYYSGAITASPNAGYPPAGAPSVSGGSLPPISASSIAPYPSPFGGPGQAFYPPFDNRPFYNGRCDDQDQFRQVRKFFILRRWPINFGADFERRILFSQ